MSASPLVTVIIPNYNHARYLPLRIESVLNQNYKNIEVIILDDCSPDNSREIIDKYAASDERVRTVYNEQNSGSTFKQWNKGFKLAKGDFIWIAESDDSASPEFLDILVSRIQSDKGIVVAYSDSFDIDGNDNVRGTIAWYLTELDSMWENDFVTEGMPLIKKFMPYRNFIPNASAAVFRAATVRAAGLADENYRLYGDMIFWARLIALGKIAYVAQPLNYWRTHQNNVRTKSLLNGTGLEESSRVLAAMRIYGQPDEESRNKTLEQLVNLWYDTWSSQSLPWSRHKAVFHNIAAVEPNITTKLLQLASRRFFNKASGFRILLGEKFIYRIIKKK